MEPNTEANRLIRDAKKDQRAAKLCALQKEIRILCLENQMEFLRKDLYKPLHLPGSVCFCAFGGKKTDVSLYEKWLDNIKLNEITTAATRNEIRIVAMKILNVSKARCCLAENTLKVGTLVKNALIFLKEVEIKTANSNPKPAPNA